MRDLAGGMRLMGAEEMLGIHGTMLAILEDLARRLKALDQKGEFTFLVDEAMRLAGVEPEVVADLTNFTDDPEVIEGERDRVAGQIVRLQRTVKQLEPTAR